VLWLVYCECVSWGGGVFDLLLVVGSQLLTCTDLREWRSGGGVISMISNQNFVPFLASNPYHTEMIYGSFGHDIVGHLLRWLMIPTHDVMNRFETSFHFLHVIFSPSGNVDAREKLASKSAVSLPATRQNWMKAKPKPKSKPKPKPKPKLTRTRGQGSREC